MQFLMKQASGYSLFICISTDVEMALLFPNVLFSKYVKVPDFDYSDTCGITK